MYEFGAVIKHCKNTLTSLTLKNVTLKSLENSSSIVPFSDLTKLEKLKITDFLFGNQQWTSIFNGIQHIKTIEFLHLHEPKMEEQDFNKLINLNTLHLNSGFGGCVPPLFDLVNLRNLHLTGFNNELENISVLTCLKHLKINLQK